MPLVCAIALPIIAVVFFKWIIQLADDPTTDGGTMLLAIMIFMGIAFLAFPLIEMGVSFYAEVLGQLGSA